jgi:hypothetical protein
LLKDWKTAIKGFLETKTVEELKSKSSLLTVISHTYIYNNLTPPPEKELLEFIERHVASLETNSQ